jgi:Tfp pilus assembly protein PilX
MMANEEMGVNAMGTNGTRNTDRQSRGFTLIASLLMLLLLSGIAIGLMMMVNTEGKVGGTDLQNNLAFHAAEGGIEKMYSDLSTVFQNVQSPSASQICAVGMPTTTGPTMLGVTWTQYSVMPGTTQTTSCPTSLTTSWNQISSGPDQGLWAQVIPVNMLATAQFPGGQEVSMTRTAQVALIPVFQYGVFCEGDCGFFDSPNLNFNGRVHTNSDLYLGVSNGYTLTFHNKLEAYGNVITENLPNGLAVTGGSWDDTGNVYIPTANNGCSTPTTNCVLKTANSNPPSGKYGDGSLQGAGGNPPQSAYNGTNDWWNFSKNTTNKMLINGNYGNQTASLVGTGAKKLSMPFVSGSAFPYEIIRRSLSTDSTALSQSREQNLSTIKVLLSDDPQDLPSGSVRLANVSGSNQYGIALSTSALPSGLPALGSGTYNMYFAAAGNGFPDETACGGTYCPPANSYVSLGSDWPYAPAPWTSALAAGSGSPVPLLVPAGAPVVTGTATTAPPGIVLCPPPNVASRPAGCPAAATSPYYSVAGVGVTSNATAMAASTATWNLIDGYLYVGYKDSSGVWHNVTNEWLQLGFTRGTFDPYVSGASYPAAGTNNINPNAILLLQQPADRNGDGAIDAVGKPPVCTTTVGGVCTRWSNPLPPEVQVDTASTSPYFGVTTSTTAAQSISMLNFYPINFYDAREGEPRDTNWGNNSCTTNGVMNAVEIDVGNLNRWLQGSIGSSGASVDYVTQNGYILYFSDRRGMLFNPTKGYKSGDSGLEDVINRSSAGGVPDGVLEPIPVGHTLSPEDVNQNGVLDEYGTANLGMGQYGANGVANQSQNAVIVAASPDNPYTPRISSCVTTARKSWVSGARHVLKLVDGTLGNVPIRPVALVVNGVNYWGGFTVAAENPVYVQGDYNSNPVDTFFTNATAAGPGADMTGHSATSVIADTVTVLSNSWSDLNSMTGTPTQGQGGNRIATTTYYRLAVAGGKNIAFPFPAWENATDYGFGTDGGIHNFLHFLEDWGGQTLNYGGSLVSLYYSTYNTGVFKCCQYSVYAPPSRNYIFDSDFTNPGGLPPGTPMFRDVESLSYRQMYSTRQTSE